MKNKTSFDPQTKNDQQIDLFTVRAKLFQRRHTLASWSRANGYLTGTVYNAISGRRTGAMSRRIVTTLLSELAL